MLLAQIFLRSQNMLGFLKDFQNMSENVLHSETLVKTFTNWRYLGTRMRFWGWGF